MSNSPTKMRRGLPWPVITYLVLGFALDMWLSVSGSYYRRFGISEAMIVGNTLGQIAFVTMVGGLWGRSWLAGWMAITVVIVGGLASMFALMQLNNVGTPLEVWAGLLSIPLMSLGLIAPLVAARSIWGWSLTRSEQLELPRTEHRLEDMFFFSIAVACSIAAARMSFAAADQARGLVVGLSALILSLLLIMPVVAVTFRFHIWTQRILGYTVVTGIGLSMMSTFALLGRAPVAAFLQEMIGLVIFLVLAWFIGIVTLIVSGYRMTHYGPKYSATPSDQTSVSDPINPFEPNESATSPVETSGRREARWLIATVALATMLLVVGAHYRGQWLLAEYRRLEDPAKYFSAAVAKIDLERASVVGVVLREDSTASDLRQVLRMAPKVKWLKLSGGKITDEHLALFDQFGKLEELDLSRTDITPNQLARLRAVSRLSLADTKITFREGIYFANDRRVSSLDLSGNHITDDEIGSVKDLNLYLMSLKLARNPITDRGVTALFASGINPDTLDLSDTQVVGDSLQDPACPRVLNLDGTSVTDAVLLKLLKAPACNCKDFSLRRTKVTAAILPALIGRGMRLGQGAITERDLLNLTAASYQNLRLNGPEFSGESLTTGKIMAQCIDLSGSAVTDEILDKFYMLGWISFVRLSDTQISFAGIHRLNASEVDLRGSRITGAQLKNAELPYGRILIRHEDCTPEDILQMQGSRFSVDGRSYLFND